MVGPARPSVARPSQTLRYYSPGTTTLALQAVGERRWWVQAPTLDGGSDWYRAKSGLDTPPGVLTFSVRRDTGFDVGSLDLHN